MAFDFTGLRSKYQQVISIVAEDLKGIRTGRAKPSLVEDLMVSAYNTRMSLKELASISAPDTNMIVISPWDQSVIEGIQKAVMTSSLGVNPVVDGTQIRISIPALTGERREEMVKQVAQKVESGKQMLRNERMEGKKHIEQQEGGAGVSEDDIKKDLTQLEDMTKEFISKLELLGEDKKAELREL